MSAAAVHGGTLAWKRLASYSSGEVHEDSPLAASTALVLGARAAPLALLSAWSSMGSAVAGWGWYAGTGWDRCSRSSWVGSWSWKKDAAISRA